MPDKSPQNRAGGGDLEACPDPDSGQAHAAGQRGPAVGRGNLGEVRRGELELVGRLLRASGKEDAADEKV